MNRTLNACNTLNISTEPFARPDIHTGSPDVIICGAPALRHGDMALRADGAIGIANATPRGILINGRPLTCTHDEIIYTAPTPLISGCKSVIVGGNRSTETFPTTGLVLLSWRRLPLFEETESADED